MQYYLNIYIYICINTGHIWCFRYCQWPGFIEPDTSSPSDMGAMRGISMEILRILALEMNFT